MANYLTEDEYKSTFSQKMTDVTETAKPVVHIWEYVHELVKKEIVDDYVIEKRLIEVVYRNQNQTFDHILLPTGDRNTFIVIVINIFKKEIKGHFLLDLNKGYGICP